MKIFSISQKISMLNKTTLESLGEQDTLKIIEKFIESGLKILSADFGFAWWKLAEDQNYNLVYKSPKTPYTPKLPRERGGNFEATTKKVPVFIENVKKKDYEKKYDVSSYMKSYAIIPICYKDRLYGNFVICYKQKHEFSIEDKELATSLGNAAAQAITIHKLVQSEFEARALSQKNEAYFRALIKNSSEIIMLVDEKANIIYTSSSITKISGYSPSEVVGKSVKNFLYDEDSLKLRNYFKKIFENPDTDHINEFKIRHKNGSMQIVESTALNMLNNPSIKGIVVNVRDITEKKSLELSKENERLLLEEKQKVNFIAEANHELRTPLAIIRGNVDLILKEAGKNQRRYADSALIQINDEVKHLTSILSDFAILVRDYSTVQSRVTKTRLNISSLLKDTKKRCEIIAKERKIKINFKGENIFINGDKRYLERLFINLIRNAIFYGKDNGKINIDLYRKGDLIEVKVKDNGIGISQGDLPYIFNRFYRVDKSHSSDERRTGLGLAICKWIAEAHGGQIKAESILGKGSTFTVILPLNKPQIKKY